MSRNHGRKGQIVRLWREQKGKCYLCGGDMRLRLGYDNTATLDHVIPRSRTYGDFQNTKAACHECNKEKGNMTDWEYRAFLAAKEAAD